MLHCITVILCDFALFDVALFDTALFRYCTILYCTIQCWMFYSSMLHYLMLYYLLPHCVCVYSSTSWFLPAARRLWHTWDVRINDLLLRVLLGVSAKFLHLHFWIYHVSTPKTKTPTDHLLERKRYDIMLAIEKMIYIDIGYKSALHIPASDENILKIRRLL